MQSRSNRWRFLAPHAFIGLHHDLPPPLSLRQHRWFAASSFHIFGAEPNKKFRTALIGSGWCGMNILREAEDALAQQTQDAHRAAPSIAT